MFKVGEKTGCLFSGSNAPGEKGELMIQERRALQEWDCEVRRLRTCAQGGGGLRNTDNSPTETGEKVKYMGTELLGGGLW